MIPVLEAFGKAPAAQAGIRADREKQETSPRLNLIKNVVKAEAGQIAVRVPGGAAVASRVEEEPDRHAEMSVAPDGLEAATVVQAKGADHRRLEVAAAAVVTAGVQAKGADHRRLEVAAVAVVTAGVQAKAVDSHRPEHVAAAAVDSPEPRVGEIKAVAVDKAVHDHPKAAAQEARVVDGAVAAAASRYRRFLEGICFKPEDPV
jgi:hypothetical protein